MYILISVLSIYICVINIYQSGLNGNIAHMENGKEPNAGVSLVSYIFVPVFFIGIAYIGNLMVTNLGWYSVLTFFGIYILHFLFTIPKELAKYNRLLNERNNNK